MGNSASSSSSSSHHHHHHHHHHTSGNGTITNITSITSTTTAVTTQQNDDYTIMKNGATTTTSHENRLSNDNNDDDDDDSDTNDDCQIPCFSFIPLFRNDLHRNSRHNNNNSNHNHNNHNNNNSRHNNNKKTKQRDPILGSPLPDTPVMERRRRQQVTQKASTVLQREQQQQQQQQQQQKASSTTRMYHGLEKEESLSSRSFQLSTLIPPTNPNSNSNNNNNNILTNGNFLTPPNHENSNGNNDIHSLLHIPKNQQHAAPPQPPPPIASSSSLSSSSVSYPEAEIYEGDDCEEKLHDKYELCEVLGVGSTSTVHRCIHKATGNEYACKIIDIQNMDVQYHSMMIQFHTEITSLKSIHHPGIIQLYDVYILSTIKIYIIMELMLGGELFDYVVEKGTLSEEEAAQIVRTVLSAIHYLHTQNIIHRDLKPENLLLKYKPSDNNNNNNNKKNNNSSTPIDVKIIDFGLSKLLTPDDTVASTFLGTRGYLAPEMLQRRDYTSAVDTWAMGVIVFVLLCGCLPFDDDVTMILPNDDHILQKRFVLRFPRWAKNLSASAKDLLNHLLDINPLTRYTAEQALYHPWVRGETAPSKNLLASPGRIRKSPATARSQQQPTRNGSSSSNNNSNNYNSTKNHLGRKYAPDPCSLTPPTPRVRKGSF